jgi:hypothetical protein
MVDGVEVGGGRRLGAERGQEVEQPLPRAFHLQPHAVPVVQDPAAQTLPGRQPVNERAKADALDDAPDVDVEALYV